MKTKKTLIAIPVSILLTLAAFVAMSPPATAAANRVAWCESPTYGRQQHDFSTYSKDCLMLETETITIRVEWKPDGMTTANCQTVYDQGLMYGQPGYRGVRSMHLIMTETARSTSWYYPGASTPGVCSQQSVDLGAAVIQQTILISTPTPYSSGRRDGAVTIQFGGNAMEGMGDYAFNFVIRTPERLTFKCQSPVAAGGLVGGTFWHDFLTQDKYCSAQGNDTMTIVGYYAPAAQATDASPNAPCQNSNASNYFTRSIELIQTAGGNTSRCGGTSTPKCGRCKNAAINATAMGDVISNAISPSQGQVTGGGNVGYPQSTSLYDCNSPNGSACNTAGGGAVGCGASGTNDLSCTITQNTYKAPTAEGISDNWATLEYGRQFLPVDPQTEQVYRFDLYTWTGFADWLSSTWSGCLYLTNSNRDCWAKKNDTPSLGILCRDQVDITCSPACTSSTPKIQRVRFTYGSYDVRGYRDVDTDSPADPIDPSYNDETYVAINSSSDNKAAGNNDVTTTFGLLVNSNIEDDYDVSTLCEDDFAFQDGWKTVDNSGNAYKLRIDNTPPDGTTYPKLTMSGCDWTSGTSCWAKANTQVQFSQQWYDAKSTPNEHYFVLNAGGAYPFTFNYHANVDVNYNDTTSWTVHTAGAPPTGSDDPDMANPVEVRCTEASGCTGNTVTLRWTVYATSGNKDYTVGGYMYDEVSNGRGYCFTFPCSGGTTYYFKTDTEAPTIALTSHSSGQTYYIAETATITGTASDGRSGLSDIQYCVGSGCSSWTNMSSATPSSWSFTVNPSILNVNAGQQTLRIRAIDRVGNGSTTPVELYFRWVPYNVTIEGCTAGSSGTSSLIANNSETMNCVERVYSYDTTAPDYVRMLVDYLDADADHGYFYYLNGTWSYHNSAYGYQYITFQAASCSRTAVPTNGYVDYKFVWNANNQYGNLQNNDPNIHVRFWQDDDLTDGKGNTNGYQITGINWYERNDQFDILPAAPSGLSGTADSTTQITWSWTDNSGTVETGFNLHDGSNNSRCTAGANGTSCADTGLTANTQYTRHAHAYNTATSSRTGSSGGYTFDNPGINGYSPQSSAASKYTRAISPAVTCARTPACTSWGDVALFTFSTTGGFGAGTLSYYRYAWDQSSSHTWTGSESTWNSSTLGLSATADGSWYLHVRSYNGDNEIGGTTDYGPFLYQGGAPTAGTVTPTNNATAGFVDSPFDLNTTFTDIYSGVASCQYNCSGGTGNCDGTWRAGTWTAGSPGTCSTTGLTCTNGQALTLNMRATNNLGHVGTGTAVNRTCDTAAPTTSDNANATWRNTDFSITLTRSDGTGSGVSSTLYCVDTTNTCTPTTTYSAAFNVTCASGSVCDPQYVRYYSTDNVGNTETVKNSTTIRIDKTLPTTTIVGPAAGTWETANFVVDVTNADTGSGLNVCYYRIYNGSSYTLAWTAYTCNTDPTITVGASAYCNVQGTNTCQVEFYNTDVAGNTGTTVTRQFSIDWTAPTMTSVAPATITYTNNTSVTNGTTVCSDATSGLHATPYDVQYCNDGSSTGDCTSAGTWSDNSPAGYSTTNTESFTGAGGNYYRFRGRCRDVAGNVASWTYSPDYVLVDVQAPNNPVYSTSFNGYNSSAKTVTLTSGQTYGYDSPTGPYFEWTAPSDNPASPNSGIAGYYVYFGTNSSADPTTYQTGLNYTNSTSLTAGTIYYFRMKTVDRAGNISSAATLFTYRYSGGGYLRLTEIDDDGTSYGGDLGSTDNLDGVLAPNGTDQEIILVYLYDEWDNLAVNAPLNTKSVTLTLGNVGSTGAYIAATNLGGATIGGTSVTGTLSGGWGWIKVKATGSEQATAVTVTASATGLSGGGGRNQKAYILVRNNTNAAEPIGTVYSDVAAGTAGDTVMMPVWSYAGDDVVFAMRSAVGDKWNLYIMHWNGSGWNAPTQLTNNNMNVQPDARFTYLHNTLFTDYVVFATYNSGVAEMYAVKASGADSGKTLAQLATAGQKISNSSSRNWWDAAWSRDTCLNGYGDKLLVSYADGALGPNGNELWLFSGAGRNITSGLPTEADTTKTEVTRLGGYETWAAQPAWSKDCSKIVFVAWDIWSNPSKTGVYVINLTDSGFGQTATLPITSLSQQGVYKIHECTSSSCTNGSALFPTFTDDGTMISYMVDPNATVNLGNLIKAASTGSNLATTSFFSGENFDNYLEYILDQPTFAPQQIGQSANNEFGLVQCFGASCPYSANGKPFTYITQKTGSRDGKLAFLELNNVSTITSSGGLMFYQGAVTAVIPPGAVDTDLVLTTDTAAPSGAPASQDDILVSTGEAREFFPDGVAFGKDIRMIFRYCDTDNSGYLDVRQNATCSGGTGGDSTIDENKLYVYYFCKPGSTLGCTPNSWIQLDGSIDATNNYITVVINHFSKYDVFGLMRGVTAPQVWTPINIANLHTYPNPWRKAAGNDLWFSAGRGSTYDSTRAINIDVQIFDLRGKLVRNLTGTIPANTLPAMGVGGTSTSDVDLIKWDVRNNSGSQVASGVYMYVFHISDGNSGRTYTGKLAIVK